MPRCDTCLRCLASAEVRKLPGRDAHRCKDKFACLLAQTNSEPFTISLEVTVPAKSLRDARQIADELVEDSKRGTHLPMVVTDVRDEHGNRYDHADVRDAVRRAASQTPSGSPKEAAH